MNRSRITLCSLLALIATVPLMAQGTYTQIDDPFGVNGTNANAVDTAGDIVGFYYDSASTIHGFLLSGSIYTTIDYPSAATFTNPTGINDLGQVVGHANPNYGSAGFVYDVATQAFTTVSYPGAPYTYPNTINNSGDVVGAFSFTGSNPLFGFESNGSQYREIKPVGAANSNVSGITASGELVGFVTNGSRILNFLFLHGKYKPLTIPNLPNPQVTGINLGGTAFVGYYFASSTVTSGFIYQNNSVQVLQFPGSNYTIADGINATGEVVGSFLGTDNLLHGFTWTPSADAPKP